eukprot:TRINITY_DN67797_c1_g4_i3.p1 TRINITY_DN67797_c1_g4~~TRINITY_DN67797_c1_g4_i3.p1  ORF type:complete len:284 (-),score=33.40 TRINITY_DN67797_c1_g4_i3:36-887(-)
MARPRKMRQENHHYNHTRRLLHLGYSFAGFSPIYQWNFQVALGANCSVGCNQTAGWIPDTCQNKASQRYYARGSSFQTNQFERKREWLINTKCYAPCTFQTLTGQDPNLVGCKEAATPSTPIKHGGICTLQCRDPKTNPTMGTTIYCENGNCIGKVGTCSKVPVQCDVAKLEDIANAKPLTMDATKKNRFACDRMVDEGIYNVTCLDGFNMPANYKQAWQQRQKYQLLGGTDMGTNFRFGSCIRPRITAQHNRFKFKLSAAQNSDRADTLGASQRSARGRDSS